MDIGIDGVDETPARTWGPAALEAEFRLGSAQFDVYRALLEHKLRWVRLLQARYVYEVDGVRFGSPKARTDKAEIESRKLCQEC